EAFEARAQAEDVLPATVVSNFPNYVRGPRIIHVPQSGDERASVNTRNEPEYTDEDGNEAAPQPRRRGAPRVAPRTTPRWGMHNEKAPLPAEPRHTVLAPPLADGPTPVKPTPRFGPKAAVKTDAGEKFGPPRPISSSPPPPPISYKPPDARPSGL
ncbi:MAG: hypothetical protein ABI830_11050, partial [Pseudolabrys sp.]